jgi:hypothetical protein
MIKEMRNNQWVIGRELFKRKLKIQKSACLRASDGDEDVHTCAGRNR